MTNHIQNKTALITGATSGIGEQLAFDLAEMGLNLVLTGRSAEKLAELKERITAQTDRRIDTLTFDVRDAEEVATQIEALLGETTVDILINNAGLALGLEPIDRGDIDQWDTMIDTNIKGLLYVTRALLPHLKERPTAHIINLGSVAGKTAYPGGNVYCATKAAVHSLTEGLNADLYGTAVKAGTIAPGAVETRFSDTRFGGDSDKAAAVYAGYTPLTAADISQAVISMLNTPPHVNIQYMDIMPTAQRNPFQLYREES